MRKLLALLAVAAGLAVGLPSTSSAGGWVVVSLDEMSAVHAGEETEIGFTALRHGTTPERADDLAIVVTGPTGSSHRFEAAQQGAPGHYVARVTLPEEGEHTWKVTGTFVDAELGSLDVTSPSDGGPGWAWNVAQWGTASLAVGLAGLAALDARHTRRQRRAATAAA
jgi:hypothetical protein